MRPRITVKGAGGMLGKALMRQIPPNPEVGPIHVIVAAGRVSGIKDNSLRPLMHLSANLGVVDCLFGMTADRLVYVGSSCMYPRECRQPMREEDLWTGKLEPTNEGYAIAKLVGEAACRGIRKQLRRDFRTAILCNLYGSEDRGFTEPDRAHVIPDLIRKLTAARNAGDRSVMLMGTGRAIREFMHVDDAALALLEYLESDEAPATMNVGTGEGITIAKLAAGIAQIIGYKGKIVFSKHGEDGMPRKVMDIKNLRKMGFQAQIGLWEGLERVIKEVYQ